MMIITGDFYSDNVVESLQCGAPKIAKLVVPHRVGVV